MPSKKSNIEPTPEPIPEPVKKTRKPRVKNEELVVHDPDVKVKVKRTYKKKIVEPLS